jgi:transposase
LGARTISSPAQTKAADAPLSCTLIETARLNEIVLEIWLADVIARIADHSINRIEDLLPWK